MCVGVVGVGLVVWCWLCGVLGCGVSFSMVLAVWCVMCDLWCVFWCEAAPVVCLLLWCWLCDACGCGV